MTARVALPERREPRFPSMAMALCSSLLLLSAAPSSGYTAGTLLARAKAHSATTAAAGGAAAAVAARSGAPDTLFSDRGGRSGDSQLAAHPNGVDSSSLQRHHPGSQRDRIVETVAALRGGSPAVKLPGYEAASAALSSFSIPATAAAALTAGPALFAQGLLLSLVVTLDGFRVREHFVSYGYGFSVALQASIAALLFRDNLHALNALHAAGLVAYGLRLVLFCRWRDSLACFQNRPKKVAQPSTPKKGRPYPFWVLCSSLYTLLALPSVYAVRRLPVAEGWVGVSQAGLATMAVGLVVEGLADWQKSQFKKKTPSGFCSSGLFRLSRHPNYFGEVLFWTGVWLAAIPSFSKWYHFVFAALGPLQIVSIILRATGGLEMRQAKKYGASKEWKEYVASTPVLVPGSRQYEWGKK